MRTPQVVPPPASETASREDSPRRSLLSRLAEMRFLTFSLLFHAILVVFAGSVILFKVTIETPDFTAGTGDLVSGAEIPEGPKDPVGETKPEFKPAAATSTTSTEAITSTLLTPSTFNLPVAPTLGRMDPSNLVDTKALGDKIASTVKGAGAMPGGTSRFFGSMAPRSKTGALVGRFYDAKQTRSKKPTEMDVNQFSTLITKFVEDGWKESTLNDFYRAPAMLSTTQIFIPNMSAEEGPKAFEVANEVKPSRWLVHYRGKVSPPKDGDFRFVGAGDDYLVVRINGKVVLDHGFARATKWEAEQYYNYGWTGVPKGFARGDKFHAVSGQYYDLDVLVSERPGGLVFFCLLLEDQGVEYQRDGKGNPILPIFRLADLPMPELLPGQTLPPFLPNGPVWKAAAP